MTARERKPIQHGTHAGYIAHVTRGDVKRWRTDSTLRCLPCIDGHAEYNSERRTVRRQLELATAARATVRRLGA